MTAQFISCQWNAASYGAGSFVVASAVAGYNVPSALNAVDGGTYRYYATDGTLVENGTGVWSAGTNTMTRAPIDGAAPLAFVTPPVVSMFPSPAPTLEPPPATVIRYDIAQTLTSAQQAQANANIGLVKENRIVNPAMMVSQENGTSSGTSNGYYAVDQFAQLLSTTAVVSSAQIASVTPAGSPNRFRSLVTSVDTSIASGEFAGIATSIEANRIPDLLLGTGSAKTFTLRFGVNAPAGTYCVSFRNAAQSRSYVVEYTISAGEAYTDVVKTITITGDTAGTWGTGTSVGLSIFWSFAAGSTYQTPAGVWTTGNYLASSNQSNFLGALNQFLLFDVGLYAGTIVPEFRIPDYVSELRLCQRYFIVYTGSDFTAFSGVTCPTGGNQATALIWLSVQMRAAPTISSNSWEYYNGTAWVAGTTSFMPFPRTVTVSVVVGTNAGNNLIRLPAALPLVKMIARM